MTVTDCGEPTSVVCALPAVSVIENDAALVNVDSTAMPPTNAFELAAIVHTVGDV